MSRLRTHSSRRIKAIPRIVILDLLLDKAAGPVMLLPIVAWAVILCLNQFTDKSNTHVLVCMSFSFQYLHNNGRAILDYSGIGGGVFRFTSLNGFVFLVLWLLSYMAWLTPVSALWVGLGWSVAQRCIAPLLRIVSWPPTLCLHCDMVMHILYNHPTHIACKNIHILHVQTLHILYVQTYYSISSALWRSRSNGYYGGQVLESTVRCVT